MKAKSRTLLLALALLLAGWPAAAAQQKEPDIEVLKKTAPKVYVDCGLCDHDYIRTEITFVNYVRDRTEAQIHVLITTQSTGSGGREYTLSFIGQHEFKGSNDTQKYFSNKTDTQDEIRQGLVKVLKIGLMSYVAKTPIRSRMEVSYAAEEKPPEGPDRWNYWLFSVSGNGYFSGEKYYSYRSMQTSLSANRVTPELKLRLSLSASNSNSRYDYEGTSIESPYESYYFNGLLVKSISEHWSVGGYFKANSSTYQNIRFSLSPAPAVEYNFFPYSQSTRRQLRVLYTLSFNTVKYREITIYDKTAENLLQESLSITLEVKEKWGSVSTTLAGAHYFHDFSKYNATLFTTISLQLFKGVNFYVFGGGSRIHDQIYLPKGEATLEDILLRRRALETGYEYFFGLGLSYTFGSIFTNVVNPRFGNQGSGGVSIMID